MNILLTSVGRRAYMVKYFRQALNGKGEVHVCNSDDLTVAFQYADKSFLSPLIYDEAYIPTLLRYCKDNKIDILLSLFDIDLFVLAKNRSKFAEIGTRVIVSAPDFISICNDKWKTYEYLRGNGFHVPETCLNLDEVMLRLEKGEMKYPIIVKPRFGCGSIGLSVAQDEFDLLYLYSRITREIKKTYLKYESAFVNEKVIFQQLLEGQEYGVDIINDLNGNFRNAVIKKKIAMRSGETDIAETTEHTGIFGEAKRLGEMTGHIANLDCDFFLVDNIPYILELNARFGGGYPFSHMAGVNLPEAIVKWIQGDEVEAELLTATPDVLSFKELVMTDRKTVK